MKHEEDPASDLARAAERIGVPLSPDQTEALLRFESMLSSRAGRIGAISGSDLVRLRQRHILDCLRCAPFVRTSERDAYDLGSGAGLPGIVVAIARPQLRIGLVEPRRVRVAFLELAVEELGLSNARILARQSKDLSSRVDVAFARALAPPGRAWALAEHLLRPGGRLVCFVGAGLSEVPEIPGVVVTVVEPDPAVLESAGPLVIMARE